MTRILVINANPKSSSLCRAMAERYRQEAAARHEVELVHIGELDFDPDLHEGYSQIQDLESDLQTFQQQLLWAQHLVIVTPVWWGVVPARLKGLFDRVLLPGFAFRFEAGKTFQTRLLEGRTSELLITLDTPVWWYRWVLGQPIYRQLKQTVLAFVGIRNRQVRYFGPVIHSTLEQREDWLAVVARRAASV